MCCVYQLRKKLYAIYFNQSALDVRSMYRCAHQTLEENARDLHKDLQRQLSERQTDDTQLCILELSLTQS